MMADYRSVFEVETERPSCVQEAVNAQSWALLSYKYRGH